MNITDFSYRVMDLRFVTSLHTARGVIPSRKIILVHLHCGDVSAEGQAAPMPEHGTESFDLAFEVVALLAQRKTFPPIPHNISHFDKWLKSVGVSREYAPTVAWALECAMASHLAFYKSCRVADLLSKSRRKRVSVSALISGKTTGEVLWAAEKAVSLGYPTVKVKLGLRSVSKEVEMIQKLHAKIRNRAGIRVDANEEWSLEHAIAFCQGVFGCGLEYVEDPLREPTREKLIALRAASPIPIALDQFANTADGFDQIIKDRLCIVIVIKPAVIGSFVRIQQMVRKANARKIAVVFSNLLESSTGLRYAAACAAAFGSRRYAHGLGTASLLARDTMEPPFVPRRGKLHV